MTSIRTTLGAALIAGTLLIGGCASPEPAADPNVTACATWASAERAVSAAITKWQADGATGASATVDKAMADRANTLGKASVDATGQVQDSMKLLLRAESDKTTSQDTLTSALDATMTACQNAGVKVAIS